jgi:hypothetical protein
MTAFREALVLPCLFLTVALLGGFRLGGQVRLLPPTLIALVLAVLLFGSLVRAGVVRPERLMNSRRTTLENITGAIVLLTLFAASAQVFNLVTPDSGLLHLLVSVFFLVQLLTTLAAVHDRTSMLRSLVVLLGCAFVLRFVALEALYSPGRGLLKRMMTAVMEGVTLGALNYEPSGAATGYAAFFALTLFLIGLALAAPPVESPATGEGQLTRVRTDLVGLLLMPLAFSISCSGAEPARASSADATHTPKSARDAALESARVWSAPAVPVSAANLRENPPGPGSLRKTDVVSCRFVLEPVGGLTPKFRCELPNGEVVKVKYGRGNPELYAEVAATRLLAALGFGADRMYVVQKVRCLGCPTLPFPALKCHEKTGLKTACLVGAHDGVIEFDPAVVERRLEGRTIEAFEDQGWAWYELARINPSKGGASRAELDAFRLIAVVLAHWDNKAENQRLMCPLGRERTAGSCEAPLALIQDLGAAFGPNKLDLSNWRRTPVWTDARQCRVSMKHLPYNGATYPDLQISDEGRRQLLGLLEQLSERQLRELFEESRVTTLDTVSAEGRDARAWATAFLDKVRQVRDAGPCPAASAITSTP